MISFHPAQWYEGLRDWLYADFEISAAAADVEKRIKAGEAAVIVAKDASGRVVGMMATSASCGYLCIEAVAGGPAVMRAAIQWSKEMVRLLGLKGARAWTQKPGVVYHMARAGARVDQASLSWEA
ncbi:hypothetical protein WV31_07430 [Magnetospirillum sp. ME-1]|uniref:hypothetical protein n=1 Tax=Magnetospirillum sp. ME-1 TaxID=1639348 RepID=UPI000A17E51F|nr:hypothetical protein [Magnetospirillum sp. ME-1]ARJ65495.1 hypothetical protein WV31_07430 [Magnetospirillum sp. ME-1]